MKRLVIYVIVLLAAVSCTRKFDRDLLQWNGQAPAFEIENLIPYEYSHVEVPEGKAVIVTRDVTDTIAILTQSMDIRVPKSTAVKAGENPIKIDYITLDLEALTALGANSSFNGNFYAMTMMFEDTRKGDHDYNDLVVEVHLSFLTRGDQTNYVLQVNPIALGAGKNIAFGVTIDGRDVLLTDNCRRDLFSGDAGFINTIPGNIKKYSTKIFEIKVPCSYKTYNSNHVDWFIKTDDGVKMYLISNKFAAASIDYYGYPNGLLFDNIYRGTSAPMTSDGKRIGYGWINYPAETVFLGDVYSRFNDVVAGESSYGNINPFTDEYFKKPVEGSRYITTFEVDSKGYVVPETLMFRMDYIRSWTFDRTTGRYTSTMEGSKFFELNI